jgi:hypothetical protein
MDLISSAAMRLKTLFTIALYSYIAPGIMGLLPTAKS